MVRIVRNVLGSVLGSSIHGADMVNFLWLSAVVGCEHSEGLLDQ